MRVKFILPALQEAFESLAEANLAAAAKRQNIGRS